MKAKLKKVYTKYITTENDNLLLQNYLQLRQEQGWKFVEDSMRYLQGLMLEDMLSRHFTELPAEQKDLQQRVYFSVNEVAEFIINPIKFNGQNGMMARMNNFIQKQVKKKGV